MLSVFAQGPTATAAYPCFIPAGTPYPTIAYVPVIPFPSPYAATTAGYAYCPTTTTQLGAMMSAGQATPMMALQTDPMMYGGSNVLPQQQQQQQHLLSSSLMSQLPQQPQSSSSSSSQPMPSALLPSSTSSGASGGGLAPMSLPPRYPWSADESESGQDVSTPVATSPLGSPWGEATSQSSSHPRRGTAGGAGGTKSTPSGTPNSSSRHSTTKHGRHHQAQRDVDSAEDLPSAGGSLNTPPRKHGGGGSGNSSVTASGGSRSGKALSSPTSGSNAGGDPKKGLGDQLEVDGHRLDQKLKQLALGKATKGYANYTRLIPKYMRITGNEDHPVTPTAAISCSKRLWDTHVKAWRRALHRWDDADEDHPYPKPPPPATPSSPSTTTSTTNSTTATPIAHGHHHQQQTSAATQETSAPVATTTAGHLHPQAPPPPDSSESAATVGGSDGSMTATPPRSTSAATPSEGRSPAINFSDDGTIPPPPHLSRKPLSASRVIPSMLLCDPSGEDNLDDSNNQSGGALLSSLRSLRTNTSESSSASMASTSAATAPTSATTQQHTASPWDRAASRRSNNNTATGAKSSTFASSEVSLTDALCNLSGTSSLFGSSLAFSAGSSTRPMLARRSLAFEDGPTTPSQPTAAATTTTTSSDAPFIPFLMDPVGANPTATNLFDHTDLSALLMQRNPSGDGLADLADGVSPHMSGLLSDENANNNSGSFLGSSLFNTPALFFGNFMTSSATAWGTLPVGTTPPAGMAKTPSPQPKEVFASALHHRSASPSTPQRKPVETPEEPKKKDETEIVRSVSTSLFATPPKEVLARILEHLPDTLRTRYAEVGHVCKGWRTAATGDPTNIPLIIDAFQEVDADYQHQQSDSPDTLNDHDNAVSVKRLASLEDLKIQFPQHPARAVALLQLLMTYHGFTCRGIHCTTTSAQGPVSAIVELVGYPTAAGEADPANSEVSQPIFHRFTFHFEL